MIKCFTSRVSRTFFCLCLVSSSVWAAMPDWKKELLPSDDNWKKTEQHFKFNNGTEPESLDPAVITGHPEFRIVYGLFEGLVSTHPEKLTPIPGVATHWDVNADNTVYTFYVRKNAVWSNGDPITAHTFVESWKRAIEPATAAEYAYQYYPIKGAEAYNQDKLKDFSKVGIKALDEQRVQVTLHQPCAYFLDLVAFPTYYPVPMDVVKKHGDRWVLPKNIVTNGPFVLEAWEPRQKVVLVKNKKYWDYEVVRLDKVSIFPFDNEDTAYKEYIKGNFHWVPSVPISKLDEVKRHPDYYVTPAFGTYYYRFNVTKEPFTDKRVRKAFSIAINRKAITDEILKAGQMPATWYCPKIGDYVPAKGLGTDRQLAKKLMKEAGYGPGGKSVPKLTILYNTSESHKKIAEALQQQWRDVLGVQVSLENTEWKVYLENINNLEYDLARSSWFGDYMDPNTFLDMFVTKGGNNRTGWSNKKHDDLLRKAQRETDPKKRLEIYQQIEKILVEEEHPIMPIYMYVNQGLLNESVLGWYENLRDFHPLKYIWLEDV